MENTCYGICNTYWVRSHRIWIRSWWSGILWVWSSSLSNFLQTGVERRGVISRSPTILKSCPIYDEQGVMTYALLLLRWVGSFRSTLFDIFSFLLNIALFSLNVRFNACHNFTHGDDELLGEKLVEMSKS